MIFTVSLFFLYSCSVISKHHKVNGMYSVPNYDMYWHKKYIADNDIITFQNFNVKDSIYFYDSILNQKMVSHRKLFPSNVEKELIKFDLSCGMDSRNKRNPISFRLDSCRILKGEIYDVILDAYISGMHIKEKSIESFYSYQSWIKRYQFVNALVYSVGEVNYSNHFKTYIVSILQPHKQLSGFYPFRTLLLFNVKNNIVTSFVQVAMSSDGVFIESKIKQKIFYTKLDYYGDESPALCFAKRKDIRKAKKSCRSKEILFSKYYFDNNGYVQFIK